MPITYSSLLGILFLGLAIAATFTMFQFWGYDYDKVNKKSSCPQWKMNIHRGIGFAYIFVYILMMTEMVPRLWEYQVEFPPRTVVHILLGTTIGVILVVKVSILRFFRHFEEWMPFLGVSLLLCSVLLGAMSLPAFFQERSLASNALGGSVYSDANRERIAAQLPEAGFPDGIDVTELSTVRGLAEGQRVVLEKCIACHDLRTIISKPRTPSDWVRTTKRMVDKPSLGVTLSHHEGHLSAAYLIAITPDLQKSAKAKRQETIERDKSQQTAEDVLVPTDSETEDGDQTGDVSERQEASETDLETEEKTEPSKEETEPTKTPDGKKPPKAKQPTTPPKPRFSMQEAKRLFSDECSLCHAASDVDDAPPSSRKEVDQMLARMVDNGLDLEKDSLEKIRFYLIRTYVKKK